MRCCGEPMRRSLFPEEKANTIALGDHLEVLALLPAGCVDLTVFSPPYDAIRDYGNNYTLDLPKLGEGIYRVTKPGGVVAMVIGDGTKNFRKSLTTARTTVDWCDRIGFGLFETLIYSRQGTPGAWWNSRFRVDHEFVLLFFKGDRPACFDKSDLVLKAIWADGTIHGTTRTTKGTLVRRITKPNNGTKCRGTVWHYPTASTEANAVKNGHPATFPDALAADLIRCFSKPGEIVMDPCAGSGTTLLMADKLKRCWFGIEIHEPYVKIAKARLLGRR